MTNLALELDLARLAAQAQHAPAALISVHAWMIWASGVMMGATLAVVTWRRARS